MNFDRHSRFNILHSKTKTALRGLFFLQFRSGLYDFASLVVAALFAGPMREDICAALRAFGRRDWFHLEEFTRSVATMVGMSLFGESHKEGAVSE